MITSMCITVYEYVYNCIYFSIIYLDRNHATVYLYHHAVYDLTWRCTGNLMESMHENQGRTTIYD